MFRVSRGIKLKTTFIPSPIVDRKTRATLIVFLEKLRNLLYI
jgi:hypothetical protein